MTSEKASFTYWFGTVVLLIALLLIMFGLLSRYSFGQTGFGQSGYGAPSGAPRRTVTKPVYDGPEVYSGRPSSLRCAPGWVPTAAPASGKYKGLYHCEVKKKAGK